MIVAVRVEEMTFRSEGMDCAARVYRPDVAPGEITPCVVMANGFSLTRDDGLPAFAERFAGSGGLVGVLVALVTAPSSYSATSAAAANPRLQWSISTS